MDLQPKALACCLVTAGRGTERGKPVTLTVKSRPFGLLVIGAIVALVSACSTSDGATPTLTTPISSSDTSSPSQSVTSTSSQTSMSSSVTATSSPQSTETSPWPADLTPDQVADAQAAIAAYVGYFKLVDQAYADPSRDWSTDAAQLAADPVKSSFLRNVAGTAQLGQYRNGSIVVHPTVVKVEPGVVSMTACVDATDMGFFDKAGNSIKAPDAPGSYFRHMSEVQVAKYEGGQWLVTFITDDYNTTC